jgi:hypothetical protein
VGIGIPDPVSLTGKGAPQGSQTSPLVPPAAETFQSLSRRLGGALGLAWVRVGVGHRVHSLGSLASGVAWSTMKVPLAIATVRHADGDPGPVVRRLIRLAITQSDNEAAMRLWSRLGSAKTAAAKTQAVLRDGGDRWTVVPSKRRRPEYSPFGQSDWSVAAQATFAASLPCMKATRHVLALMSRITASQRWGVGSLDNTVAFKGGWGPRRDGRYLVRQLALVNLGNGARIGLSLASIPEDGSFRTGAANLNKLARWAARNVNPGGESGC